MMANRKLPPSLDLLRGEVLLGRIDVKPGGADGPWSSGTFHPAPQFASVRDLFARELALLKANENDDAAQWDDWEAVYDELAAPGLRLFTEEAGGAGHEELIIHIDGAEAWWRDAETEGG
jgi:hypothetical protein